MDDEDLKRLRKSVEKIGYTIFPLYGIEVGTSWFGIYDGKDKIYSGSYLEIMAWLAGYDRCALDAVRDQIKREKSRKLPPNAGLPWAG